MEYAIEQVACGPVTEDRAICLQNSNSCLIVVADGVGGVEYGGVAAELITSLAEKSWRESRLDSSRSVEQLLKEFDLIACDTNNCGQTTAVVIVVKAGAVFGASVGDCEAWLMTDQGAFSLTSSQRSRPLLGSGKAEPVAFRREALAEILLVGSDGLFRQVSCWTACEICSDNPPREASKRLVSLAKLPDGNFSDDVSVVVCKFP